MQQNGEEHMEWIKQPLSGFTTLEDVMSLDAECQFTSTCNCQGGLLVCTNGGVLNQKPGS
jgi:hypothetical protein